MSEIQELVAAINHQTKAINALVECNTKLMTALIELNSSESEFDDDDEPLFDLSGKPIGN